MKKSEVKETIQLTEKHDTKQFDKFIGYVEKYLNSTVIIKNNKYKFCPKDYSSCYIAHREDNALFEIYRFYAKVFNVSKREIEDSFIQNKEFKKVEVKETDSGSSGSVEGGNAFSSDTVKRKINKIHNFPETDINEISIDTYDVPFGDGGKNPLKVNGPKSVMQSRAVKDKNFPKWGGPGGVFVKVKEKCKKFPYCNQGNTGAIEFYEVEGLKESVQEVSKKYGIPYSEMEKIVINEIKKIFI
jgi:hypothetical protein